MERNFSNSKEAITDAQKEVRNEGGSVKNQILKRGRYLSLRIKKFFIRQHKHKRALEFGCHKDGIHLLTQAIFYSEAGCLNCKKELD